MTTFRTMVPLMFCSCFRDNEWDYMPFRAWVGLWTALFILLIVAFDLSALVSYITRFTEECFACLIALIFIYEAFAKTFAIEKESPVQFHPEDSELGCFCVLNNITLDGDFENITLEGYNETMPMIPFSNRSHYENRNCSAVGGILAGDACGDHYVPNVFFFSLILFFGTFVLAIALVKFRNSLFFPMWVRILFCQTLILS